MNRLLCALLVASLALICFDNRAAAAAIDYSASENAADFGHLRQADLDGCGNLANEGCGPSAAVNSFLFLQKTYPDVYGGKLIPGAGADQDNDGDIDEYDGLIAAAEDLADNYMATCC